jgi:hypothetical protein
MRVRCKHKKEYSGIEICGEWDDFKTFLADMGERPEGMTLDRTDGRKGYFAKNCRWASPTTQSRNRREQCGVQWSKQMHKFKASIGMMGKAVHLGYFDDWLDAMCSRKSAENKYWRQS